MVIWPTVAVAVAMEPVDIVLKLMEPSVEDK
jgi:hypothetical protein